MVGNISGKALFFTINGATVTGPSSWEATETGDELDGTTGLDGGFQSTKIGTTGIPTAADLLGLPLGKLEFEGEVYELCEPDPRRTRPVPDVLRGGFDFRISSVGNHGSHSKWVQW